jgi:hypothetical protein
MKLAALATGLMLAGCATTPGAGSPPGALETRLSWLTGNWSNAAQYDAAPEALRREPAPGHPYDWLDAQYAEFHRIDAPMLGDHVIYLEWRAGDSAGPISRQRIWVFHAGENGEPAGMDFYTLRDAPPYAGRGDEPGAFQSLSQGDLVGYPDGCTLAASQPAPDTVAFRVDPDDCLITARSGRQMGIRAEIRLEPGAVTYSEAGILEGGRYAFLVPGGENLAYAFRPATD